MQVDLYLCVPRGTIYSKKNTVKEWDASNYIKASHDALSKMIEKDDRYFFVGPTQKVLTKKDKKSAIMILKEASLIDVVDLEQTIARVG